MKLYRSIETYYRCPEMTCSKKPSSIDKYLIFNEILGSSEKSLNDIRIQISSYFLIRKITGVRDISKKGLHWQKYVPHNEILGSNVQKLIQITSYLLTLVMK